MGKIVTIKKTTPAQAVKITTPEEEKVVRGWLADMFVAEYPDQISTREQAEELAEAQELEPVVQAGFWFARDHGSNIVYMIEPDEFEKAHEVVSSQDVLGEASAFKIAK